MLSLLIFITTIMYLVIISLIAICIDEISGCGFSWLNPKYNPYLNIIGIVIINIIFLPFSISYWFYKIITWKQK